MDIRIELVSYSFALGFWAFFNPCGSAMLPAYIAHYLGSTSEDSDVEEATLIKGLSLGLALGAGFLTVFSIIALIFALISSVLLEYAFWFGAGMGLLLIILGVLMLLGKNPLMVPAFEHLAGQVEKSNKHDSSKDLKFYYFFGISYAIASLGCSLPVFLPAIGFAFSVGSLNGVIQFGAYAMGMILTAIAVSIAMVYAREWARELFQKLIRAFRWIGGFAVIGAGIFLIWYNLIYSKFLESLGVI
jgi:cytochrome c biogenesis protein CcdA